MENAIDKRFERQETAFVSSQKAAIKLLASHNEQGFEIELQAEIKKNARNTHSNIVRTYERTGDCGCKVLIKEFFFQLDLHFLANLLKNGIRGFLGFRHQRNSVDF